MANKKRSKQKTAAAGPSDPNETKATADAVDAIADDTQLLPPALIARVFDHALQPAVVAAAGVCRSWRAVAQTHKEFYGSVSLDGDKCSSGADYVAKSLDFSKSLSDACAVFKRLSVSVHSPLVPLDDGGISGEGFKAELCALMAIKRGLSSICRLDLSLADRCCTIFHGFFHQITAPVLDEFRLEFVGDDGPGPYAPLPNDLFKSSAPLLQKVELQGVALTAKPVAAFAKVQELVLDQYSSEQLPFVAPNFPGMTHLKLDFLDLDYDERYPGFRAQSSSLKSLGAKLKHFELRLYASDEGLATALQDVLEKQAIPRVTVDLETDPEDSSGGELVFYPAPFLSRVGKPFRVCMRQEDRFKSERDTVVEVFSLGSHFRRLFRADADSGLTERLLSGEELRPHVRDLELESVSLPGVCACVRSLPRLRSLAIDLGEAQDQAWFRLSAVDCPSLQAVALRSPVPRQVSAFDVATILKIFVRGPEPAPVVLTLVKLRLEPIDHSELDSFVKEIHLKP